MDVSGWFILLYSLSTAHCPTWLFTGKASNVITFPSSLRCMSFWFRGTIGDVFALHAGYNGVAEVNNVIVLYPQVQKTLIINPQGCWDWYVQWIVVSVNFIVAYSAGGDTQELTMVGFAAISYIFILHFLFLSFQDRSAGVWSEEYAGQSSRERFPISYLTAVSV